MRLEIFPSFSSHENAIEWGMQIIEFAAQSARGRYLTLAPGQDAAYVAKLADAKSFLQDQDELVHHPWIALESAARNMTPLETAQNIIQAASLWENAIGPKIEAARITGKIAVRNAISVPELCRAARAAETVLNEI